MSFEASNGVIKPYSTLFGEVNAVRFENQWKDRIVHQLRNRASAEFIEHNKRPVVVVYSADGEKSAAMFGQWIVQTNPDRREDEHPSFSVMSHDLFVKCVL